MKLYSGEYIASCLEESLKSFGISKDKLALLLRDNAANGVKACKIMKIDHFGCIAHGLHLVVGPFLLEKKKKKKDEQTEDDGEDEVEENDDEENNIEENEASDDEDDIADFDDDDDEAELDPEEIVKEASKLVTRLRNIAKYIKNSTKAKEKVMQFGGDGSTSDTFFVLLDVRTRWNSTLLMLESMLKIKQALQMFLVHLTTTAGRKEFKRKVLKPVSEEEWVFIEGLCLILTPFNDATKKLSADTYPTIAQALPTIRQLQDFLKACCTRNLLSVTSTCKPISDFFQKYQDEVNMKSVASNLKGCATLLLKNFNKRFSETSDKLLWVTLLDPRSRQLKHLTREEKLLAKVKLLNEVTELSEGIYQNTTTAESQHVNDSNSTSMWGSTYDSPIQLNPQSMATNDLHEMHRTTINNEINSYLGPKHIPPNVDPLEWWRSNRAQYPNLALAARKWLCVPVTSTPSERVFSHCGVALSAKRSRMKGAALMNQVLLKNNLKHVKLTTEHIKKALLPHK